MNDANGNLSFCNFVDTVKVIVVYEDLHCSMTHHQNETKEIMDLVAKV